MHSQYHIDASICDSSMLLCRVRILLKYTDSNTVYAHMISQNFEQGKYFQLLREVLLFVINCMLNGRLASGVKFILSNHNKIIVTLPTLLN